MKTYTKVILFFYLFLFLIMILNTYSVNAKDIIWSDDFNRANNAIIGNDWTEVEGGTSYADILSNRMRFVDTGTGSNYVIVKQEDLHLVVGDNLTEETFIEFEYEANATTANPQLFTLVRDSTDQYCIYMLYYLGYLTYYVSGYNNVYAMSINTQYNITLTDINFTSKTFDIYVDGTIRKDNAGFFTACDGTSPVKIWLNTGGNVIGTYYYDNFEIYTLSSIAVPSFDITHIAPVNNSRNNTNLFVYYNSTLDTNCSININGTLNQTVKNINANTTYMFNVSMTEEGYYMYNINCSESAYDQTDETVNQSYNYDPNAPPITWVYPQSTNNSVLLCEGDAVINVSCTDQYLYWSNFTAYTPAGVQYYNNETNISMAYTVQTNNLTILNMTTSGVWDVQMQCWDSHTDTEFKVKDVIIDQTKQEWQFITNKDDIIKLSVYESNIKNNIVEMLTTWEYDRYTFNLLLNKDIKKSDYIIFNIETTGNVQYLPNSPYPGHFIIGFDYWLDFAGVPNTKVTYLGHNKVRIDFVDKVEKDKISFKSFGGLNYNEEWVHFTVLSCAVNTTGVSCIECFNATINCSINYTVNSSGWVDQQLVCENYLNTIPSIDDELNMIAIVISQILLIVFLLFTGFWTIHQHKMDMNKTSFWLTYACFTLVIIEVVLTTGLIYLNESGSDLTGLLYLNFLGFGLISALTCFYALTRILLGLFDATGENDKIKEW